MYETSYICDACKNIESTAERIRVFTESIDGISKRGGVYLVNDYDEFRLNELEHLQRLVIDLTELLGMSVDGEQDESVNIDEGGSVFAQGDLTSDLGDKTDDRIGHIATEGGME